MAGTHLFIRIDLASGDRSCPGKIALLDAIRATGSISALREPAVTAETGGSGSERVVGLYRTIESQTRTAVAEEFRAMGRLMRHEKDTD
jgi:molybdenum-dependent DNA-binding transcriptional regulator ModE